MAGVALGVAIAVVVACGGPQTPIDWEKKLRMENQITDLWTQIRDWRRQAKLNLEPPPTFLAAVRFKGISDVKRVCTDEHEVPPRCDDICGLGTAICDNVETICQIADELGKGDEYAQDKCASAKASCLDAKKRCCDCSATPPEGK